MVLNPFNPRSGANPHILVGRDSDLEVAKYGIDFPGSPESNLFIHGPRGVGKTALMFKIADYARHLGWETINTSMGSGLLARVEAEIDDIIAARKTTEPKAKVKADVNLGILNAEVEFTRLPDVVPRSFIRKIEYALALLEPNGLLISIDEIQANAGLEDFDRLGNDIQILQGRTNMYTKQQNKIAFVMGGLSSIMMDLLKDKDTSGNRRSLTFLRKAERVPLLSVSDDAVRGAIRWSLTQSHRVANDGVIEMMVDAIRGYPFLIQLVGYHVWRQSDIEITAPDALKGIQYAKRKLGSLIHETALNDLSDVDKTFLLAMTQDKGGSRMKNIVERMGVNDQYAQVYKERLKRADMITQTAHGSVDFTLPWMKEYLLEHSASLVL
jgi:hypothetical protein